MSKVIITYSVFFVMACIIPNSFAQSIDYSTNQFKTLTLDQIQFRGVHNAYQRQHSPRELIDDHNIWELELDFGKLPNRAGFIVGHDGPDSKFGLRTLADWINDVKSSDALNYHPIILKLEAKTKDTCGDPTCFFVCCWEWTKEKYWGNWQRELIWSLENWLGPENWITKEEFQTVYHSKWPTIKELAGKFIVLLIDNNSFQSIDTTSPYFFTEQGIPGLSGRKVTNQSELTEAVKAGVNRIIMEDQYLAPWSYVLVHPPIPSQVDSYFNQWQLGTVFRPFFTIGHAVNANFKNREQRWPSVLRIPSGSYPEKVTFSGPLEIVPQNGTVTIGGDNVSYTIIVQLMNEKNAGTRDKVFVNLAGTEGTTSELPLANAFLDKQNAMSSFWLVGPHIGNPISITVRIDGGDDTYIDDIIVLSASTGWHFIDANAWVGNDNVNPRTFYF